ncbi:MAG TPA: nuclear transport factor 2 family protein [Acidimicrobiales bacterium]|jgi:ketosteroid isomerase-like protein|nr:nuclear transport factor 2 family protein [Acidimicrobiales bacterium]
MTTSTASTPIREEESIRSVLNDRLAALHDKDAARFVAHYSPAVVKFDLAPPLVETGPDVLEPAGWQQWFDSWDGPIVLALARVGMQVSGSGSGDMAVCHCVSHMTGQKVDGEEVDLWFRSTYCFALVEGRWLIVHEHSSVPFAMDGSGLACLDLVP